mgnify:FL=1
MDNDDMRRGKPSSHIKFGEANALLAGDSLLTFAFQTAGEAKDIPADAVAKAVSLLARAAGCAGMIAGQVQDLENENKTVAADDLRLQIQHRERFAVHEEDLAVGAETDDRLVDAVDNRLDVFLTG